MTALRARHRDFLYEGTCIVCYQWDYELRDGHCPCCEERDDEPDEEFDWDGPEDEGADFAEGH